MTPTAKFRWLEMSITGYSGSQHPSYIPVGNVQETRRVRVLQQWWTGADVIDDCVVIKGEWRDIPIEEQT